jgi:hypothetical protein
MILQYAHKRAAEATGVSLVSVAKIKHEREQKNTNAAFKLHIKNTNTTRSRFATSIILMQQNFGKECATSTERRSGCPALWGLRGET